MGAVTWLAGWIAHVAVTAMVGVGLGVTVIVGRDVSPGWMVAVSICETVGMIRLSSDPLLITDEKPEQAVNNAAIQSRTAIIFIIT